LLPSLADATTIDALFVASSMRMKASRAPSGENVIGL
jgi:hypothetical protein